MIQSMAMSLLLVLATILIHYEILRLAVAHLGELPVPPRFRILVVVVAAFAAHTVEVWLYGLFYYFSEGFGLGEVRPTGDAPGSALSFADTIYFSAATFCTIGYGDVVPFGAVRLVAAVEGINGLLLIAWSASATYVAMEKYWPEHGGMNSARKAP